jgi:hypothetical protein
LKEPAAAFRLSFKQQIGNGAYELFMRKAEQRNASGRMNGWKGGVR